MKSAVNKVFLGVVAIFVLLFGVACGVLQEPAAPSATLEAAPLELEEENDTTGNEMTNTNDNNEENAAADETADEAATDETAADAGGTLTVYNIAADSSQVRFELDEDLRGNRITVVGTTDQVAGQIGVNYSDLSQTEVGEIRINARTLTTDNDFRNRAIANRILETGTYEFITFVPTAVNGLSDSVAIGDSVEFTIVGDLTIRDITNEVTFDVTATAVSETEFSGTASTVITRDAYNLQIPEVPNVANVEEEVELYIDFVANAG